MQHSVCRRRIPSAKRSTRAPLPRGFLGRGAFPRRNSRGGTSFEASAIPPAKAGGLFAAKSLSDRWSRTRVPQGVRFGTVPSAVVWSGVASVDLAVESEGMTFPRASRPTSVVGGVGAPGPGALSTSQPIEVSGARIVVHGGRPKHGAFPLSRYKEAFPHLRGLSVVAVILGGAPTGSERPGPVVPPPVRAWAADRRNPPRRIAPKQAKGTRCLSVFAVVGTVRCGGPRKGDGRLIL